MTVILLIAAALLQAPSVPADAVDAAANPSLSRARSEASFATGAAADDRACRDTEASRAALHAARARLRLRRQPLHRAP